METRHLIEAIVRQTTILIAQLSTAAGIRAPLARIADQVFLELSKELEAQGVTRKVAADMFGLALRSYQRKIQRLAESVTDREQTLWSAVLDYLREHGGASRQVVLKHFERDGAESVAAVLKDLVTSGLVSSTGRGAMTHYELASAKARATLASEAEVQAVTDLVWLAIYDEQEIARADLLAKLPFEAALSERAVATLIDDGRIECQSTSEGDLLRCLELSIPVGSEQGWEAAVFDHFRAMATAIAGKVRGEGARSAHGDVVGGSTVSFSLEDGHPLEAEIYGLLRRVRADVNALLDRANEYNRAHPVDPEQRIEVTFYFGQSVLGRDVDSVEGESG